MYGKDERTFLQCRDRTNTMLVRIVRLGSLTSGGPDSGHSSALTAAGTRPRHSDPVKLTLFPFFSIESAPTGKGPTVDYDERASERAQSMSPMPSGRRQASRCGSRRRRLLVLEANAGRCGSSRVSSFAGSGEKVLPSRGGIDRARERERMKG